MLVYTTKNIAMTNKLLLYLILTVNYISYSQITIEDKETMEPVSFATISFGNGNGLFADEDGKFIFTKERYKDIDTLVITSIGYNELKISTGNLAPVLKLSPSNDQLTEVFIQTKPKGKFKTVNIKPVLHDDYFKCWLPTIESEIAVYFPNDSKNIKQISKLFLPIKAETFDWKKRKKANAKKRNFSTLCKVNFYENNNGYPGKIINYEHIVFRVTQETEAVYELNLEKKNILIPENGIYASIQILGYTNKDGNLLPNKNIKK